MKKEARLEEESRAEAQIEGVKAKVKDEVAMQIVEIKYEEDKVVLLRKKNSGHFQKGKRFKVRRKRSCERLSNVKKQERFIKKINKNLSTYYGYYEFFFVLEMKKTRLRLSMVKYMFVTIHQATKLLKEPNKAQGSELKNRKIKIIREEALKNQKEDLFKKKKRIKGASNRRYETRRELES
ncbi:hypothetical protein K502DRAFT_353053 [Neoconidiobolus thromboides FSU 785]|nr:hypothetical protein K502DRAFT_353053 [Neoconidiobolus thromboides FSU 785]